MQSRQAAKRETSQSNPHSLDVGLFDGSANALDAAYFNALFETKGIDDRVTEIKASPIGTGQMASSIRYTFAFSRPPSQVPASLVGKFPSPDPSTREFGRIARHYEREARFYDTFVDIADRLAPRPFHADAIAGLVFLEDMAPAVQGDQLAGCAPGQAELAMDAAATLHAARWNATDIEEMGWLQFSRAAPHECFMDTVPSFWEPFEQRYLKRIDPLHLEVGRSFVRQALKWYGSYSGPRTLTHGDFRLDNLLFGKSAEKPVAIVDWQTPAVRGPLTDVSFFIGSSLCIEDRRSREDALLQRYWQGLLARGVSGYSFEDLWRDYRWFAFHGLIVCFAGAMIARQTPRGDDMFMSMYARHAQHVIDLDALDLL